MFGLHFYLSKSLESINIHCLLQSFFVIFLTFSYTGEVCSTCFLFFEHNLLHICINSHVHTREMTASPSHAFPLFGCRAAPLEQLGGCSWFKDTSAVDGGGEDFQICFPYPDFPQCTVHSNWSPPSSQACFSSFSFYHCPSVVKALSSYLMVSLYYH